MLLLHANAVDTLPALPLVNKDYEDFFNALIILWHISVLKMLYSFTQIVIQSWFNLNIRRNNIQYIYKHRVKQPDVWKYYF